MKDGDELVLKSGGPKMTIEFIDGNEAYCEWFMPGDGKVNGHRFTIPELRIAGSGE